jgi:tetratricopeptide (TPR) repeat protein
MRLLVPLLALTLAATPGWAGLLEDAQAAVETGDFARAVALAERLRAAEPPGSAADKALIEFQAHALNALGVELAGEKSWEEALTKLQEARRLAPENRMIIENMHSVMISAARSLSEQRGRHSEAWALLSHVPENLNESLREARAVTGGVIQLLWAREFERAGREQEHRRHLERAIEADPGNVPALIDLGEWYYTEERFDEAIAAMRRALDLDPSMEEIRQRILQMGRERRLTAGFVITNSENFRVSHPRGEGAQNFVDTCLIVLEDTRTKLAQEFRGAPRQAIRVVVYREDQFRGVTLAPDWAQASFDGKLRVVIRPIERYADRRALQDTLSHELTHAFVFDRARRACPVWLNEGLAQHCEINREISRAEEIRLRQWRDAGTLTAFSEMPNDFSVFPTAEAAQRAYLQCVSFTSQLIRRFGAHRLWEVLEDLGRGDGVEEAIQRRLHHSLDELDQQWRGTL